MTSFCNMSLKSDCLGVCMPVTVFMPDNSLPKKVLYLLHGLSDDNTAWSRWTSAERYADELQNVCVIMPTTHRFWYTNTVSGMRYWDYIAEELPEKMKNIFNIPTDRDRTFVAGLSMGGYGCAKLGLRKPDKFRAVFPLSGALDMKSRKDLMLEYELIFGKELSPENDLFDLAEKADDPKKYPYFGIYCGYSDFLKNDNDRFYALMKKRGFDVDYTESEGDHCWQYWDRVIPDVFKKISEL